MTALTTLTKQIYSVKPLDWVLIDGDWAEVQKRTSVPGVYTEDGDWQALECLYQGRNVVFSEQYYREFSVAPPDLAQKLRTDAVVKLVAQRLPVVGVPEMAAQYAVS